MELFKGNRYKLDTMFDLNFPIDITIEFFGDFDCTCFGLDKNKKLTDDRYMIFYNQLNSPNNEIALFIDNNKFKFKIALNKLTNIENLVFALSTDSNFDIKSLKNGVLKISGKGKEELVYKFDGSMFTIEKSLVLFEIYHKDTFKLVVISSGYKNGLDALLKDFGGEIIEEVKDLRQIKKPFVSLEKKLDKSPELISLAKPITIVLEKKKLTEVVSKVALVVDISGSMSERYMNGSVDMIVSKTVPLAIQFDDDGELDFWYYGTTCKRMPSITLENYKQAVPKNHRMLMNSLGGTNNEPKVMKEVIDEYKDSKIPAYILFITDGGISKVGQIKKLLIESSNYPIFWQFVGVGGVGYSILRELDTLKNRKVDNTNFFAIDDFRTIPNDNLYEKLLNEFPLWLQEAKRHNILF